VLAGVTDSDTVRQLEMFVYQLCAEVERPKAKGWPVPESLFTVL